MTTPLELAKEVLAHDEKWPGEVDCNFEETVTLAAEVVRLTDENQGLEENWKMEVAGYSTALAMLGAAEANMDEARKLAARYKEMLDYIAANGSGSTLPESWPVWVAENLIADTD